MHVCWAMVDGYRFVVMVYGICCVVHVVRGTVTNTCGMVYGVCCMLYVLLCIIDGWWCVSNTILVCVRCVWLMVCCACCMVHGLRFTVYGAWLCCIV